ncbi:DNA-binding CsgD family transcriptional regulator/thioredoxin-like negative regulator of GroEL [Streptomyces sp. SAI-208]|uniref:AAA family ATPase n=1 Tax=Streptomyces sp. SAI-208 TaxID=2940550 RepID=UPI0024748F8E|nr:LuxR family transcriptional regulator [Streptomyces sp. SAI-208]MDH6612446.1 DNA-binding CsgD family transcriptional regulator/thioredoxin-like negative regulator of GroEL [Streptomyces sp. SAI-208]
MDDAVPDGRDSRTGFVGRQDELAELRRLYGKAAMRWPGPVVVEGPPGIGKTALVRRFVADTARGRVLTAAGEENEVDLPYGVLGQLLGRPVHVDPLTAGAELLHFLSELQEAEPVVVVVDDAHWADAPSLHALTFALRRLREDHVLCLFALRDVDSGRLPGGLRRILLDDTTVRLRLAGLTAEDFVAFSARFVAEPLPPAALRRLHAHTQGNPLHCRALLEEAPSAVLRSTGTPLPAPQSYTRFVLDRLARCASPARALVRAAAVLGQQCGLDRAARVAGIPAPVTALGQAMAHGLLQEISQPEGTVISFPHSLVRAAVYHGLGPVRRTALHARAAESEVEEFTRLHHTALAAYGPDDGLSAELAHCARRRGTVGRWVEAAPLLRHAARLAVRPQERGRLDCEAVEAYLFDGREEEAAAVVAALPEVTDEAVRNCARGHLALTAGHITQARVLLDEAWRLRTPGADVGLEARIAEQQVMVHMMSGHATGVCHWAERARDADGRTRSGGTLRFIHLAALGQLGLYTEGFLLAASLPEAALAGPADIELLMGRGVLRMYADRAAEARHDLERAAELARSGPVPLRVVALAILAKAEFLCGSWDAATLHWETASSVAADLGQGWIAPVVHAEAVVLLAARGEYDLAAQRLRTVRDHPVVRESAMVEIFVTYARAHLAYVRGDATAAVGLLRTLLPYEELDFAAEPGVVVWRDLLAESLVATGRLDEAEEVLSALERRAADRCRASTLASVCRVRGSLYVARREPKLAEQAFTEAVERAARVELPFERARAELDLGCFLRRTGRRVRALDLLKKARARLVELDAVHFLRRCDQEVAACGQAPGGAATVFAAVRERLTPQEHAVVRLATRGLTNRQIARELVLSAKTVEYHLSHAYAKLGVRSRVELVARAATPTEGSGTAG